MIFLFQLFALFTLKLCQSSVYDHARYCRLLQLCKISELPVMLWRLVDQKKQGTNLNSFNKLHFIMPFLYCFTNYKMCCYSFFKYLHCSAHDHARYCRLLQLCKFLELPVFFWRLIKQTKKGTSLNSLFNKFHFIMPFFVLLG